MNVYCIASLERIIILKQEGIVKMENIKREGRRKNFNYELSKLVEIRKPTWFTTGSGWVEFFLQISIQIDF